MSYQEALESLKNGDFQKAAELLEKAAIETGYTSEVVNHAYTLALYRIGDKTPGGNRFPHWQVAAGE
jgi:hypothetical protein